MNKGLKIISNVLFLINSIILCGFFTHILDFSLVKILICSLIVFVLFIINAVQLKNKNAILNDKKYNIMFLLVNVIVLVIFLRDEFDSMIPFNSIMDLASDYYSASGIFISSGIFTDYNMIFIIIMYSGILIYNLLNKDKDIK